MKTYSAIVLIAALAIVKPFQASSHTLEVTEHAQSKPAPGKITIISNNLSGDSVSVADANRYSVILTKHEDGNLDLNLDQIDVNNASGKSMNDKVIIHILSMSKFEIDLSALPAGVYQIKTKTGSVTVEKK
ncbi:hypothetical protein ACFQ21_06205 [Ohtaekwangia kribbensis]|jgi:hypothetical protein|uniref:Secretion system C-terminal sorting domain-containing protein n=1 Tax=Ohtaekwangia kribbensis TaxID=688913 RepID=A0ABW3JY48_9BACT